MEQIKTTLKKWGNSFGIVVPMETINNENLKEGSEIIITIHQKKAMTVGDLMELGRKTGIAKKLKGMDTEKALKEVDRELWPEEE